MNGNDSPTTEAPGPLEDRAFGTLDSIESGFKLIRDFVTGELEIPEGVEIADDIAELVTLMEDGYKQTLAMLYEQATALDRLRRGLCQVYGLDYEKLDKGAKLWKISGRYCPTDANPETDAAEEITLRYVYGTREDAEAYSLWYVGAALEEIVVE